MGTQNQLPFLSLNERDRRWKLIRKDMEERGLDCLVIQGDQGLWGYNDCNVRYVTGIGDFGYALFPLKEDPICFVWWTAPYQARRSKDESPLTSTIRSKVKKDAPTRNPWALEKPWVRDIRQGWPRPSEAIVTAIKDLGLEKGTIGLVSTYHSWEPEGTFPYTVIKNLYSALPQAELIENATDILEKARLRKSTEEIRCIEVAGEIADRGIEAALNHIRPGVNEVGVYAKVVEAFLAHGSERLFMNWWASGQAPTHTQYFVPTDRIMCEGDILYNEYTPRYGGYVAHPHQPISIGKPIEEYQTMFALLKQTRDEALSKLKPGVTIAEQTEALTKPLEDAGYSYLHCPFHGLGLSGLEFPNAEFWGKTSPYVVSPPDMVFEEGMVLAYEPMISTPDRKIGFPLGDTVIVTKDGSRRLSKYCDDLIVV
ncbi:MAG: Xaa-Pro peptidase family protein [Ardenticatenaceae bacterium]|nr:Xaa-Pro peptidase family protein [Ardenticatenaceae bacterium]